MASGDVQVDVIYSTIKRLQQEKSDLENKLAGWRSTRAAIEGTQSALNSQLAQVTHSNNKMKETLKVAQHKVSQSQSQLNAVQENVDMKRMRLTEMNSDIACEKNTHLQNAMMFENQLSDLTVKFIEQRKVFENDSLIQAISSENTTIEDIQNQHSKATTNTDVMRDQFQRLQIVNGMARLGLRI